MAQTGPELHASPQDTLDRVDAARDFDARLGREPLPRDRAVRVAAGETVSFGFAFEAACGRGFGGGVAASTCRWSWAAGPLTGARGSADTRAGRWSRGRRV